MCVCVVRFAAVFCMVSKPCMARTLADSGRENIFFSLFIFSLYYVSNLIIRSFTCISCRCVNLKLKSAHFVSIVSVALSQITHFICTYDLMDFTYMAAIVIPQDRKCI